jgi:UDP-glucose 4-epimerase
MNVLVLGGNGFIGSHLVDKLLAENHKVRVFDKNSEIFRKQLDGVDYRYGEFGNRGLLNEALNDIDLVFHFICSSLPKTSNDDPAYDVQSNVIETIFLLETCVSNKIKKVIFISSGGTVYGRPSTLPIAENSATNPECSYGITKLTIEKYFALYKQLYGLDYCIVRPSNPYGSRQNPDGIQGAIAVFLRKVSKNEPIEIWGDGQVIRDYIYIDDLIDGIYRTAVMNTFSKIFNIGTGIGYSLNDVIKYIRTVCGRSVNVVYKTKRLFDIHEIYLDISRAQKELEWKPATSFELGLSKTWEFVLSLAGS